ncbi:uncharacterized protein LOC119071196 [Bradysia coprophila]|uniref:uncharacterized protein LOC119071196 n=1 Tax=Bradysia coprophila TaxID=38358 RepID=UPI00187D82AE|nr:uncharacterized protein LOC119071196 [Bradysia coprophila]
MAARSDKELQRKGHEHECFVCKKECYNTCSRCGEFYCSKACQTVDWREHKYYCFEMPELIMKSTPFNGQQSNNSPKFQSDNWRVVQNLRSGEYRSELVQSSSSENSLQVAESRHSERTENVRNQDEESIRSSQPAVFNFGGYPKNNDDVVITHVRHANVFYIRTCSSGNEYKKNAKAFDDYGRKGIKLLSVPQKNDVVLVLYDGKFLRALVLNVESEEIIEVGLVDTGRKVNKSFRDMRQLSDELKSRERYNFLITLDQIPRKVRPIQFKKLFDFLKNETVFKIQFDGNDWKSCGELRLIAKDSGFPIETLILGNQSNQFNGNDSTVDKNATPVEIDSGLSMETLTLKDEPNNRAAAVETTSIAGNVHSTKTSEKPISLKDLATETLPEVAALIILDNSSIRSGYVSAIAASKVFQLDALYNKVNQFGNVIHEVYEPEPDELCLVQVEGEWYRAMNCGSKFLLIDWGNMEDVDRRNIRRFPQELNDPCYTFVCIIQGAIHKLDEDQIEQLSQLLEIQSEHPDCSCVKVDGELMEYNVKFPKLLNIF